MVALGPGLGICAGKSEGNADDADIIDAGHRKRRPGTTGRAATQTTHAEVRYAAATIDASRRCRRSSHGLAAALLDPTGTVSASAATAHAPRGATFDASCRDSSNLASSDTMRAHRKDRRGLQLPARRRKQCELRHNETGRCGMQRSVVQRVKRERTALCTRPRARCAPAADAALRSQAPSREVELRRAPRESRRASASGARGGTAKRRTSHPTHPATQRTQSRAPTCKPHLS